MAEADIEGGNIPQNEPVSETSTNPEPQESETFSYLKISELIQAKSALDENESNIEVRQSLSAKIESALSGASAKIFEKLGRGERVTEEEHLILAQDLTERSERSALANCFLSTQGLNTFQEAMGKANVKNVKNEELEVALDKHHKNPWIKEQLKKIGISAGFSAATLGVVSLLGGPVTWLGFAAGVGGGALGRFVGEKLRQRNIAKDAVNEKMILELLGEITLLRSKAKDVLSAAENPDDRASKINDLLRNVFEREKIDSVVNYSKVDSRARKISAGLGFIGAVGSSLASSALVHAADVASAMTQAKSEGVRIFHDAAGAHLSLDPSVGHEVYQTNDGVWRFMIENKDVVTAQENFGPNWSDWFHVVGAEGSKGDVISAPTLEKLQEIATQHGGLSMLFHNSAIAEESVRAAVNQSVNSLTNLTMMVGTATLAGHSLSELFPAINNLRKKEELKESNQLYYQALKLPANILDDFEESKTPEEQSEEPKPTTVVLDNGETDLKEVEALTGEVASDIEQLIPIMEKPIDQITADESQVYQRVFDAVKSKLVTNDDEPRFLARLSDWISSTIDIGRDHGAAIKEIFDNISKDVFEGWFAESSNPKEHIRTREMEVMSIEDNSGHGDDKVAIDHENGIYAVFDGVSSGGRGSVSSAISAEAVLEVAGSVKPSTLEEAVDQVKSAILEANQRVLDNNKQSSEGESFTTATVVKIWEDPDTHQRSAIIGNVGDSRAYVYHKDSGELECLTLDDGLVRREVVNQGGRIIPGQELVSEEVAKDRQKTISSRVGQTLLPDDLKALSRQGNVVTKTLGEEGLKVDPQVVPITETDVILACSDGISDIIKEPTLSFMIQESLDPSSGQIDQSYLRLQIKNYLVTELNSKHDDVSFVSLDFSDGSQDQRLVEGCDFGMVFEILSSRPFLFLENNALGAAKEGVNQQQFLEQAEAYKLQVIRHYAERCKTDQEFKKSLAYACKLMATRDPASAGYYLNILAEVAS